MNLQLAQAFHFAFLLFGSFAVLNAYLKKWGPSLAMFGIMLVAFIAGLLQGVGGAWTAFVVIIVVTGIALYFASICKPKADAICIENAPEISARMMAQMERNVAKRKARK